MDKAKAIKWIKDEVKAAEITKEQRQEFIVGMLAAIATEHILTMMADTEFSSEADTFCEYTMDARLGYYKHVNVDKGGIKDFVL